MKSKNIICIDPGTGGGIAFNNGKEIFVMNMPTLPTGCKSKDFTKIQVQGVNELIDALPAFETWVEQVGPRPCDTPKTSWRFSANYHCVLMSLHSNLRTFKLQLPGHWQAQLPVELPSGEHNYDRRKKILKSFATEKFPEVIRIGQTPKGEWKQYKAVPTSQTADALCMLSVNSGMEF